jgi:chromate transporter
MRRTRISLRFVSFLPGPASSQVGFALGLIRAGYWGGLAAWAGFTLPSAVLMVAFAYGAGALSGRFGVGLLHGLKLVAVAIVAQAVWGMARTLCPDRQRAAIAALSAVLILSSGSSIMQLVTILLGGAGSWLCRTSVSRTDGNAWCARLAWRRHPLAVAICCSVWLALPLIQGLGSGQGLALFDAFYRSGALVFGGGHVVLPLLRDAVVTPGWVSDNSFLAGYGAAQAIPGPLFTFAAYLGAVVTPQPHGIVGAALGARRHLSSGCADFDRDAALLGQLSLPDRCASGDARHQRRGRRIAGSRTLYAGMDKFGAQSS